MRIVAIVCAVALQAAIFSSLWIISDAPGYGLVALIVLLTVWVTAEACCQRRYADHPGRRDDADGMSILTGYLVFGSLIFACIGPFQMHGIDWPSSLAMTIAGAVMAMTGVYLRCAAIAKLGRFFHNDIALSPTQTRVTSGIYRYLRHPSEIGTVLATSGTCLAAGSPVAAVIAIAFLSPVAMYRCKLENTLMDRGLTH